MLFSLAETKKQVDMTCSSTIFGLCTNQTWQILNDVIELGTVNEFELCCIYNIIQLCWVSIVMVYESVVNLLTTIELQGWGPSIAQSERKKTPAGDSCKDLAPMQRREGNKVDLIQYSDDNQTWLYWVTPRTFASACSQKLVTAKRCLLPASMIPTVQLSQLSDEVHQGSTMDE